MGCWSETCGVTQLPINYRDKVRLFILVHQASPEIEGGGTCYANDIWAPFAPAIQGTYNDYGGIEDIVEDNSTEIILKKLKSIWVPFTKEYEDVPSVENMELGEALHFIERGYAKVTDSWKNKVHVGMMMVLEDIYQTMIKFDPIVAHHNYEAKTYCYKPLSQMYQGEFDKWYMKISEKLESLKGAKGHDSLVFAIRELLTEDSIIFSHSYRDSPRKVYREAVVDCITKGVPLSDPKVQDIASSLLEMIRFESSFVCARRMWTPQSGKGSQQNDLDIYAELNKSISNIMKKRNRVCARDGLDKPDKQGYYPYMLEHNAKLSKESNGDKKVPTKKTR